MYLSHFGLREAPFSITPDPRFVYLSERHRDGLAHLLYGVGQGGGGGFVQLTGEVGTGKTTLCRLLLEQLPDKTKVALLLNPRVSALELLETICEEFALDVSGLRSSQKGLLDLLNAFLLRAYADGWRIIVVLDEAQQLSVDALEQLRLLTNLETATQKLLQIILLGQPELRDILAAPELRQLAQRVTARFHLTPLDAEESAGYIRHRLQVAGSGKAIFTRRALRALYQQSGGVPRLLNIIADRALLAAYAQNSDSVDEDLLHRAANESMAATATRAWSSWRRLWFPAFAVLLCLALFGWLLNRGLSGRAVAANQAAIPISNNSITLEDLAPSEEHNIALRSRLLQLWGEPANPKMLAVLARCDDKLTPQLRCLAARGAFSKLREINRPVLLSMPTANGSALLLLRELHTQTAVVDSGNGPQEVANSVLDAAWRGDFWVIWRQPAFLPDSLASGASGAAVSYAQQALSVWDGNPANVPGVFEAKMHERVRRLQREHGWREDGVVGAATWLALQSQMADGPKLTR
jgi:general secretion pathway protein A